MELTLSESAKAVKRTKQALSLAIQKGRLSARKDQAGTWRIDSAELFRAYPPVAKAEDQADANEVELLRTRLAALEAIHNADRELVTELRTARDQWQKQAETWQHQAEQLLRALPAGLAQAVAPAPTPEPVQASGNAPRPEGHVEAQKPRKRGFWRSLFGGGHAE